MKSRASIRLAIAAAGASLALCSSAHAFTDVPVLNSLPGATDQLYLNFNGDPDASLGFQYSDINIPPYDLDGDTLTLNAAEKSAISHIWSGVAEKYSPFNINVTTVDPGNRTSGVTFTVDVGGNGSWTGGTYGGISSVNGFLNGSTTGFVFPQNLGPTLAGHPRYVADAISHEAGHGFGLVHQSTFDVNGNKILEYNDNGASGFSHPGPTSPIMGLSYYSTRSLWWSGLDGNGGGETQQDMAVIAKTGANTNNFGFRPDDHPNTYQQADAVAVAADSSISAKGVIENTADVDMLKFVTTGGFASIFGNDNPDDPMLDFSMSLLDVNGNVLATSAHPDTIDPNSFGENIQMTLTPGQYELAISSANINYGDVGQYFITGFVAPEPSSVALILGGSMMLLGRRRGVRAKR